MSPVCSEALHKNVAVRLSTPVHVFIERERTTDLAVELGELDPLGELAGIQIVSKSRVGVVKVLQLGSTQRILIRGKNAYLLSTSSHSPATLRMYSYSSTIEMSFGRSPM